MPRIKLQTGFKVSIIESERDWGSKVDEVIYYDNEVEAMLFVSDYNKLHNNQKTVPDWYMYARYDGEVK